MSHGRYPCPRVNEVPYTAPEPEVKVRQARQDCRVKPTVEIKEIEMPKLVKKISLISRIKILWNKFFKWIDAVSSDSISPTPAYVGPDVLRSQLKGPVYWDSKTRRLIRPSRGIV